MTDEEIRRLQRSRAIVIFWPTAPGAAIPRWVVP